MKWHEIATLIQMGMRAVELYQEFKAAKGETTKAKGKKR